MSTLQLSSHVIERLTQTRPLMSVSTLEKIARHISDKIDQFDPNKVHQVAVKVYQFTERRTLGNSNGDCLIIAVDIRKRVIPTAFLRNEYQGRPRMAQAMIDLNGAIIG